MSLNYFTASPEEVEFIKNMNLGGQKYSEARFSSAVKQHLILQNDALSFYHTASFNYQEGIYSSTQKVCSGHWQQNNQQKQTWFLPNNYRSCWDPRRKKGSHEKESSLCLYTGKTLWTDMNMKDGEEGRAQFWEGKKSALSGRKRSNLFGWIFLAAKDLCTQFCLL